MINCAIQLFTFENSTKVLQLFNIVNALFIARNTSKLIYYPFTDQRKSISIKRLLSISGESVRCPEGYLQSTIADAREEWKLLGLKELITHLSVSPDCEIWEQVSSMPRTHVERNAFSVQQAAASRTPATKMPSVVEITFKCETSESSILLKCACDFLGQNWSNIPDLVKFSTIDIGPSWLFFPKTGYNPNVAGIHIYYDLDVKSNWEQVRTRHNVSFDPNGQYIIHDCNPFQKPLLSSWGK